MSMNPSESKFIADLMKALDISPETTRAFTLRVEVDAAVIVEVEAYVKEPPGETAIKKYRLTKEEIID